jgi:hypothetical protein
MLKNASFFKDNVFTKALVRGLTMLITIAKRGIITTRKKRGGRESNTKKNLLNARTPVINNQIANIQRMAFFLIMLANNQKVKNTVIINRRLT